ncbi:MAG: transcription termination/antitermination factor NusG [Candidatus Lambdaproteobacteria bacterium RIFOXYD1_FULL_56_27]|uniref:Transcription termination/antitermination protein NusG n=1 Tax=Candidatus Lambdaproteobacteria bacterium RIFOXYD2_FULL_56_26 TaxID=1817773 RepID=A0A1F6GVD3_9PROT|nr:MAG: transcription termination/antitermination factor NusG [Candidatus Lambdaproteobacteria bacterium RIFOXYD2_FULL_56_26]OGH03291.1 MAG: transcription termination/antitermination factor NusG [Candidatus Lambdaproteobacteria bacterium RIFOXYC1_FULL_56_13]OGH07489.1 MAG: transcription termination/antitermination factor NusG [Candidatus Lambdaproteobacteria bacterium RIFOXYD1_FULL_56_27]
MTEASSPYKWYIIQAYAGYEEKVKLLLNEQLKINKMEELVQEIFIPSEEVTTKKGEKVRKTKVTYFPGYILIKMNLTQDLWHIIRNVPKVSGFVGGEQTNPKSVSEKELESIRGQISSGLKQQEIDSTFTIGQTVAVIDGPFAEFNGVIDQVDKEHNKLTVLVSIFGRSTPLELSFEKVRLVD